MEIFGENLKRYDLYKLGKVEADEGYSALSGARKDKQHPNFSLFVQSK